MAIVQTSPFNGFYACYGGSDRFEVVKPCFSVVKARLGDPSIAYGMTADFSVYKLIPDENSCSVALQLCNLIEITKIKFEPHMITSCLSRLLFPTMLVDSQTQIQDENFLLPIFSSTNDIVNPPLSMIKQQNKLSKVLSCLYGNRMQETLPTNLGQVMRKGTALLSEKVNSHEDSELSDDSSDVEYSHETVKFVKTTLFKNVEANTENIQYMYESEIIKHDVSAISTILHYLAAVLVHNGTKNSVGTANGDILDEASGFLPEYKHLFTAIHWPLFTFTQGTNDNPNQAWILTFREHFLSDTFKRLGVLTFESDNITPDFKTSFEQQTRNKTVETRFKLCTQC